MSNWGDLEAVLMAVRHNGLSAAARVLGVTHATVARRIGQAEERLGAVLFDRTPGGYIPTDAGREAARAAERMEAASADLDLRIAGRDKGLAGDLVVTAPPVLVAPFLARLMDRFARANPAIRLKLLATNDPLNLHRREADVALRVSHNPAPSLWGVEATGQRRAVYVARGALPDARQALRWLSFTHWGGIPDAVAEVYPGAQIAMSFDDMVALLGATRAGLGAAFLPCCIAERDPKLVRLPAIAAEAYAPIWLLTHREMRRVPRIIRFLRHAANEMRADRDLFLGRGAPETG